ncbi:MAG: hypothetical protein KAS93_05960 [Gammaproteobacteria bacterium]|nr:hypothetical protein [Gammaproteobacteria bacterium]
MQKFVLILVLSVFSVSAMAIYCPPGRVKRTVVTTKCYPARHRRKVCHMRYRTQVVTERRCFNRPIRILKHMHINERVCKNVQVTKRVRVPVCHRRYARRRYCRKIVKQRCVWR